MRENRFESTRQADLIRIDSTFSRCDLDSWHLTLNNCSTSGVTWSNSVPNLNEIEQSAENYWWFSNFSPALCQPKTLTFDPVTLNICCISSVTWSDSVTNLSEIEQSAAEFYLVNFRTFFTPVTLGEGWAEYLSRGFITSLKPNPWYTFGVGPLRRHGDSSPFSCPGRVGKMSEWIH